MPVLVFCDILFVRTVELCDAMNEKSYDLLIYQDNDGQLDLVRLIKDIFSKVF